MITGEIKNKIDKVWTDMWAGGITNPLTVIEQLTYMMFIHSLDEKELKNAACPCGWNSGKRVWCGEKEGRPFWRCTIFSRLTHMTSYDTLAKQRTFFISHTGGRNSF